MAKIEPLEPGLERYFARMYAVDHRRGDPDDIVRIWSITERAITQVPEHHWTPDLIEHLRNQRYR